MVAADAGHAAGSHPVYRPAGRDLPSVGLFVILTAAVLAADLGLKAWSFAHVAGQPVQLKPGDAENPEFWRRHAHPTRILIPGVLGLRLTANTGAIFGLGRGGQWVFIGVSLVAAAVILWLFYRSAAGAWPVHIALALILAGALGNLYDRIRYGAVRDMLYLFPGVKLPWGLSWPGGNNELYPWIFNIADASLLIGILLLLAVSWRNK